MKCNSRNVGMFQHRPFTTSRPPTVKKREKKTFFEREGGEHKQGQDHCFRFTYIGGEIIIYSRQQWMTILIILHVDGARFRKKGGKEIAWKWRCLDDATAFRNLTGVRKSFGMLSRPSLYWTNAKYFPLVGSGVLEVYRGIESISRFRTTIPDVELDIGQQLQGNFLYCPSTRISAIKKNEE